MLSEWTIANFKSFEGETTLNLAPVTILAGSNSSGKSSIIQSILLIKQTLQYAAQGRPVGLNGPLLKLGRFSDIKNTHSAETTIKLGWRLDDLSSYRATGSFRSARLHGPGRQPIAVRFGLEFGVDVGSKDKSDETPSEGKIEELLQLHPALSSVSCSVDISGDEKPSQAAVTLARTRKSKNSPTPFLPFDVKSIDVDTKREITSDRPGSKIAGAMVQHFFPYYFGYTYNGRRHLSEQVAEYVCGARSVGLGTRLFADDEAADYTVSSEAISTLINSISAYIAVHPEESARPQITEILRRLDGRSLTARELSNFLTEQTRLNARVRQPLRAALAEARETFLEAVFRGAEDVDETSFEISNAQAISTTVDQLSHFFKSRLHYLGPLRDEPKPIYPLEALINPKDVGYRGEHTAAVLDLHSETRVRYYRSADAMNLVGASTHDTTLNEAVIDWLSYLGVAERVGTKDLGKIGHELQVGLDEKGALHDLTNVGVGVSQLLPIVVMSLLADSPSLLVFEQPELHLHPKVQARLADFFFSLGLMGKQCLLETHSEYLVERFRLRIAEAPDGALLDKVKIYFTEKHKGRTTCREVRLSKFGAILDWPADFFDQSQVETEAILAAAEKKLLQEQKDKRDQK